MHITQPMHDQGAAVRKRWVGLGHGGRGMLIYQTGCEARVKGEKWALLLPLLPDTKHLNLRIKNAKLASQAIMKAYLLGEQNIFDLVVVA